MTKEDRNLLVQDLCSRLPYGVKVLYKHSVFDIDYISSMYEEVHLDIVDNYTIGISEIKPYLFPLSSMTDKMLEELNANGFFKYRDTITNVSHLESNSGISEEIYTYVDNECISFLIEFFHSHHIDYRGLIEKSLALDATGLNIY